MGCRSKAGKSGALWGAWPSPSHCEREGRTEGGREGERQCYLALLEEPWEAYRRAPLSMSEWASSLSAKLLNASHPHLPRVSLLPGQRSRRHSLPSLQGSVPCSSCVMSSGLENAIPSHKKQTQSDLRLAAKEAPTEFQAIVDVKHPEGR